MEKQTKIAVQAYGHTDIGRRKNNEDAYLIDEHLGLFIVADGMGGHEKGEVASWFTSEGLQAIVASVGRPEGHWTLEPVDTDNPSDDDLIQYAVMAINKKLYDLNEKEAEKLMESASESVDAQVRAELAARSRMGTTLVSLLVHDTCAYVAHIGDSRAYRISGDSIQRLTHDHSWVEERVRSGEITPEEAKTHKKRNVITRSVGFRPEVEADIDVLTLYPPERFLLCSDGLSNVVDEEELLRFGQMEDIRQACEEMVELAMANGGKDNITAVLIDVSQPTEQPTHEEQDYSDLP